MQECCTCGSGRGALGNRRPYRDTWTTTRLRRNAGGRIHELLGVSSGDRLCGTQ
jgi:hypothetical protein